MVDLKECTCYIELTCALSGRIFCINFALRDKDDNMNKTKCIKTLFIAILALLLLFTLVACGEKNDDKRPSDDDPTVEISDDMKQLVENSRADIDAVFNYFLTSVEEGKEGGMQITTNNDNGDRICTSIYLFYGEDGGDIIIYQNEERAQEEYEESYKSDSDEEYEDEKAYLDGNKIIINKELYDLIVKSKRPANITKFTQEQVKFMENKLHRGVGKNEESAVAIYRADEEGLTYMFNAEISGGYDYIREGFVNYTDEFKKVRRDQLSQIAPVKKLMHINYTDDSYIEMDENTRSISFKLTSRPGWHVEEISESKWNEQIYDYETIYTEKYRAKYYDLETLPSALTIPASVGGYDIEGAEVIIRSGNTLESLSIEKEMSMVNLYGDIKQITLPASDKKMLDIIDNTALERINFGGTTDEWYALYDGYNNYDAQRWTRGSRYDYSTGEYIDIVVSFTVVCTNGSYSYPRA